MPTATCIEKKRKCTPDGNEPYGVLRPPAPVFPKADRLGNYDSCLACSKVTGSWRPLHGSRPYLGTEGKVSEAEEIKVEVNILAGDLERTLNAIYEAHPYEEPLVNVIPILNRKKAQK